MKNISLMKVTAIVLTITFASVLSNISRAEMLLTPEITKNVQSSFSDLDSDKDGSLNLSEVGASNNDVLKKAFAKVDADNDSLLSKAEFDAFTGAIQPKL
jgi:Ca2+-binding EF-hand superfamily protein